MELKRPSWACLYRSHTVVLYYFVFVIGMRTYKIHISRSIPSPLANWKRIWNYLSAPEVECLLLKVNLSKTAFCIMWCRITWYHFAKVILLMMTMISFLFRDEEIGNRLLTFACGKQREWEQMECWTLWCCWFGFVSRQEGKTVGNDIRVGTMYFQYLCSSGEIKLPSSFPFAVCGFFLIVKLHPQLKNCIPWKIL